MPLQSHIADWRSDGALHRRAENTWGDQKSHDDAHRKKGKEDKGSGHHEDKKSGKKEEGTRPNKEWSWRDDRKDHAHDRDHKDKKEGGTKDFKDTPDYRGGTGWQYLEEGRPSTITSTPTTTSTTTDNTTPTPSGQTDNPPQPSGNLAARAVVRKRAPGESLCRFMRKESADGSLLRRDGDRDCPGRVP